MRVAPLAVPVVLLLACGGEPVKLADEAEKLTIAAPESGGAQRHVIEPASTRTGFSKLAAKTLQALSPKVAEAAEVNLQITAKLTPGPA